METLTSTDKSGPAGDPVLLTSRKQSARKCIILTLFLLYGMAMFSQAGAGRNDIRKWRREARQNLLVEDYLAVWQSSRKVLANTADPKTAVNACIAAQHLNYPSDSLLFLEKSLITSSDKDALFYLAKIKHRQHQFDEALNYLALYSKAPERKKSFTEKETAYLKSMNENGKMFYTNPRNQVIRNIGDNINSPFADYVPVIAPDESALYFTSKRPASMGEKNADNNYFEDVFVSRRSEGSLQPAIPLNEPINSLTNDACVAMSPDGKRMILYRTAQDISTGDLLITTLGPDNKWQEPEKMNDKINSEYLETSACFTTDSAEIYFCSDRPGGLGGKDLYRIKRLPNGSWSEPYNLGPAINTPYDEDAPFFHPDGKTLYFSSKGHNTMGEYDVFRSELDKETNEFTPAENLAYPINDVGNDIFFVVSVDGQRGYYSSVKEDSYGDIDIYQVDTRFTNTDLLVLSCFVRVEGQPAAAQISLMNSTSAQVTGNYQSQAADGKFIMIVHPHEKYNVKVESENGITQTFPLEVLSMSDTSEPVTFELKRKNAQ